ncbi:uncharacterized protein BO88DRAFT_269403 [Aspergillus vadensis CBS 113365]|uniref:Secreted peptide n=1 Tax=Aspergillus vadensis (strain CBS 113365 / IMI 142717 / IBT 24658) TaxID=1448311 RepID=A0A319BAX1_ASPVC|nr:hypothetical protein BO88DRAFT_269403 [Aspergillus vadensis CBS 113365]PYH69857.1 hypothetical protein BO88DRAFT_269403 [Aspergillus vadensis CBS 113365]
MSAMLLMSMLMLMLLHVVDDPRTVWRSGPHSIYFPFGIYHFIWFSYTHRHCVPVTSLLIHYLQHVTTCNVCLLGRNILVSATAM